MSNSLRRGAALPLLALILLGVSPHAFSAELNAVLEASAKGLTYLDANFRSRDGKDLGQYQFKAIDGVIVGGVAVPSEAGAEYEITAFDGDGLATYSGVGFTTPFLDGDRPLQIVLPATDLEKQKDAALVIRLSRERLVLEAKALDEPNQFSVRVQAFDPRGEAIKLNGNDVRWGLTDTTHFELLPRDLEVVVRPLDTFPRPVGGRCDVPPKVVLCIPDLNCRMISVCPDPWANISAGASHTCAVTKSGVAYCWGANDQNELGARSSHACGTSNAASCNMVPLAVECPSISPCLFTQISAGGALTVALDINGDAWWWGRGKAGHHKITLNGKSLKFAKVTAGFKHGCGLSTTSEVWCWGSNLSGEAGAAMLMTEVLDAAPVRVLPIMKFTKVVAGGDHTCALGSSGVDVACWGRDHLNQTTGPNSTPISAGGLFHFQHFGGLTPILDVAVSPTATCVTLGNANDVSCWGRHASLSVGLLGTPDELAVGTQHVCALSGQQASCMGANTLGQLGIGSRIDQFSPAAVSGPPALFANLSAGGGHTCGLTPDGDAYCWGASLEGQIGIGNSNFGVAVPAQVKIP